MSGHHPWREIKRKREIKRRRPSETVRFVEAFERLMARGEFPSPTAINNEMGRPGSRNNLPGRLSRRRRELLSAAGYAQRVIKRYDDGSPATYSHWRKP